MAKRRRLTNDEWGVESNCFVCEPTNRAGMQLAFWADDERGLVTCDLSLGADYTGAPAVVHGGISLAVLDEVQAWAVIAFGGQFGVTVDTNATFHLPVWVDHPYRLEGAVLGRDGDHFLTEGRILDQEGACCVEASGRFLAVGEASAASLAPGQATGTIRSFLGEDRN
ncbi:MAG: PaaI family thioesterase [Actinomycetota bacterium]